MRTNVVYADIYNFAPNPSFEEGNSSPVGWTPVTGVSCDDQNPISYSEPAWDLTKARSGSKSLSLKNINWTGSNGTIPGSWMSSDFIPVNLSLGTHSVYVWARGDNTNRGLGIDIWLCLFDFDGNKIGYINPEFSNQVSAEGWEKRIQNFSNTSGSVSKVKVGLSARCSTNPCSGSIWFDDISVRPPGSDLQINIFNDLNRNGQKDIGEPSLESTYQLYEEYDCIDREDSNPFIAGTYLGQSIIFGLRTGEDSIRVILDPGRINTTPVCQNILILPKQIAGRQYLTFGIIEASSIPYLSQKDPPWGPLEYDHANTIGPFFCGTTIAGCGCAITSSAMLLKYYGVDKSPDGQPTDPQTLNDWLKTNKGYAFGALKWNSIASYSVKANQSFGTQKIKFTGVGQTNNFTDLENELKNQKPTILEEPGHYILATQIQNPTYSINDPYFEDRKTLQSYSNTFRSTRKYEKTSTDLSAIQISAPNPTQLFLVDANGKRVGKDPTTGTLYNEIPNSFYVSEPALADQTQENPPLPDDSKTVNTLIILTPESQIFNVQVSSPKNYSIDFSTYDQNGDITSQQFSQTTSQGAAQNYQLNYSPQPGSKIEVVQKIKIDVIPGNNQNPVFPKFGTLPVAILTTADFDAKIVDIKTVKLGRNEAKPILGRGVFLDVDWDRDRDLLMFFNIKELGISADDKEICLKGKTSSGTPFEGCDKIRIINNKKAPS